MPKNQPQYGIRIYRGSKVLGTLWQDLCRKEIAANFDEEGMSALSDWSGTWVPRRDRVTKSEAGYEGTDYDIVTRKANAKRKANPSSLIGAQ